MKRILCIAIALAGYVDTTTAALAQQAARQYARADSLLDLLVGEWSMTGSVRGKPAQYTLHVERILQNKYVELHMTDASSPPNYEARVTIGATDKPDQVIAHWIDNFGAEYSVPPATGVRRGDTLFLDFPYPDRPFHDTFVYDRAAKTWHFKLEASDKTGGWSTFAEYAVRPSTSANRDRSTPIRSFVIAGDSAWRMTGAASARFHSLLDSATATLRRLEIHQTSLAPGASPHPPHRHSHDEIMLVERGTLRVTQEGAVRRAGPGSLILQSSNELHGLTNAGADTAVYWVIAIYPRDLRDSAERR